MESVLAELEAPLLSQNETKLAERIAELQQTNMASRESRLAALNLMQDAVESRNAAQKLNAELRESQQRYRALFDLVPIAVYAIDTSGVIQNFNCRAADLWGRRPALGDTDQRFCGSFKLFRPDGAFMPHEECPMAQVVSGKIPAAHDAEVIIERPDGSRVTVIVNIRPLTNERGDITGAINCFYDITERKQVEALQQRDLEDARRLQEISSHLIQQDDVQMLYEEIVDAAKGIMRSDFASFQIFHPERGLEGELHLIAFRGYTAEAAAAWEWIGSDAQTSCGVALRTGHRAILPDIEACDWLAGTETLVLYRQVGIRALQSTPLLSRSGKKLGMISTIWKHVHEPSERDFRLFDVLARQAADVIERRHAEVALRRAHELITDEAAHLDGLVKERTAKLQETVAELEHFSYTITHDMRAPLRAMQGFADLLSSEISDKLSPAAGDYLRRITDAANRMDALIRDSLQYAKVVRERTPLTCVHPAPILRGILDSYPALQPGHVQVQLVEPFPPVIANESGLVQCFSNLLVNAVKFVKPGVAPKIRIWAETRQQSSPSTVRFWFEDNGIGIPREYQERIFGMFQQLDKGYEGTGIGLALVRKTAERMKGNVGVESEPDKGSRFWLDLQAAT